MESEGWVPGEVIGGGSDREIGVGEEPMDGEGGVADGRHAGREAGPAGVVAILVPPTVLQEVQTVLNPPMLADMPQQVGRSDLIGIEAADVIAHVVHNHASLGRAELAIDAQHNLTAREAECLPDIMSVV